MYHPDESRTDCFEIHDLYLPPSIQLYRLQLVRDRALVFDPVTDPNQAQTVVRSITGHDTFLSLKERQLI